MRLIKAKQILSSWYSGENWFGNNYHINLYKGCHHGCIYCDSRSECYQVEDFDIVRGKENALAILEQELQSKRKKGIVGNGAMSDPYNGFENKYQLTRGSLKLLHKYGFGASVLTKSDLVLRDIDILKTIKEHSPAMVKFTITTFDDDLCKLIEPNVTVSSKRFEAIKQLSDEGIFTGVMIWPILPFINDTEENIKAIVKEAALSGAKFVMPYFGVTLRQNQREYFYQQLDQLFPKLSSKYKQFYQNQYECISPNKKKLEKVLKSECEKYGLLYKMDEIRTTLIKTHEKQIQFSLFD